MNQPVVDILLPLALAGIMFALGLTLTVGDFLRVFARPKAMAVGLFGQLVLVPLFAFAIAVAWKLPPEMAAGLMILAACPGGVSSGLITHLARGDTALSISLTAVTSVVAVVSVPLVVNAALAHFTGAGGSVELPVLKIVRGVFVLTTVPVALGMLVRRLRTAWALRAEPAAGRIATLLFVLIVIATFIGQRATLAEHLASVGPAAFALSLAVMAAGFGLAALLGLGRRDRIAIASECGLQNAALGIFIAAAVLQAPRLTVPSVVYALLMNVSALAFIFVMRRQGGKACVTG